MQRQFLETSAHNTIKEFAKLDTAAQADPRTLQDATVTPLFFFSAVHSSVRISELSALSQSPRPRPHWRRPSAGLCPGHHPQPALPAPKDDEAKGQLHVEGEVLDSPRQRMNAAAPKPRSQEAGNTEPDADRQVAESQQRSTWQGSHGNAKGDEVDVVCNSNFEPARFNDNTCCATRGPPPPSPILPEATQLLFCSRSMLRCYGSPPR